MSIFAGVANHLHSLDSFPGLLTSLSAAQGVNACYPGVVYHVSMPQWWNSVPSGTRGLFGSVDYDATAHLLNVLNVGIYKDLIEIFSIMQPDPAIRYKTNKPSLMVSLPLIRSFIPQTVFFLEVKEPANVALAMIQNVLGGNLIKAELIKCEFGSNRVFNLAQGSTVLSVQTRIRRSQQSLINKVFNVYAVNRGCAFVQD